MQKVQNEVTKLYEQRGKLYHSLFVNFLGLGRRFEKFFRHSNYINSGIKVLDAGCGSGSLLTAFYKVAQVRRLTNITYHGFDLTQTMLDRFRAINAKQGISGIELQQADLLYIDQLPEEWRNYDLIISNGMLEYIPEPKLVKALNNLRLLLKNDGVLLIFATKKNVLTKLVIEWWWKAHTFTADDMRITLQRASFTKININNFGPIHNMLFIEAKVSNNL